MEISKDQKQNTTIAKHESIYLVDEIEEGLDSEVIDILSIDLRGW